jgi:HK97 family phage portal protein
MFKKMIDFYNFYKEVGNNKKDWSSAWLRMKEKNILNAGGTRITEPARQSYLVQKCVNIISQNAPQAPLEFFMVSPSNPREPQKLPMTAPINQLFNNPNENMSRYDFIAATSAYMTLYGEAFWYLVQSVGQSIGTSKLPAEIWVLDPRMMKEVVDEKTGRLLGWLFNNKVSLTKDEVLIFKNINPYNQFRGLSPLDAVAIEISADVKAGEYQEKFFENGSVPSMVLETGENDNSTVAELRKIKRLWEQQHQGSKNASKMGVLRGGMTLKPIGLSQMEMDFINSRQMTRDIILSIFGVPKTIAGFTEELNRATSEVQKRLFWQETVKPQLIRISTTLTNKFIYKLDINMVARFDFLQIDELQRNFEDEVNVASKLWMMGFARNELNERFALGFDDDTEFGDEKYVPLNMLNVTDDTFQPTQVGEPRETVQINTSIEPDKKKQESDQRQAKIDEILDRNKKNYEKLLTGRIKKFFFSQRLDLLKRLDDNGIEGFDIKNDKFVKILLPIFTETYKGAAQVVFNILKKEGEPEVDTKLIFKYVDKTKAFNDKMKEKVILQIKEGGTLDEIKARVKKLYNYIDKKLVIISKNEISDLVDEVVKNEFETQGVTNE